MNEDIRFDTAMQDMMDQLPAGSLPPAQVTPWRQAMRLVLWGIGLTCLTVQLWHLGEILPLVGGILMALGFRTLRRENDWLRSCWRLSVALAALRGVFTVAMGTVLLHLAPWMETAVGWLLGILSWLLYLGLWRGMLAIGRKAGQEKPSARAAGALVLWYTALMAATVFAPAIQGLAAWVMLALYLIILRRLTKLTRALDDCGYAVQAAPVKWDGRWVAAAYLGLVLAGVLLGQFLGQRLPMDWAVRETPSAQAEAVRDRLEDLGLPREILDDLTDADVLSMSGATQVVRTQQSVERVSVDMSPTQPSILFQRAAVLVLGETEDHWAILTYFQYEDGVAPGYTDGIEIAPHMLESGWVDDELSGFLLCDRADSTYAAPMRDLLVGQWEQTQSDPLSLFTDRWAGSSANPRVYGQWSVPRQGENVRGYLLYWRDYVPRGGDEQTVFADLEGFHRRRSPCYPWASALDVRKLYNATEAYWPEQFWIVQDTDGTVYLG